MYPVRPVRVVVREADRVERAERIDRGRREHRVADRVESVGEYVEC